MNRCVDLSVSVSLLCVLGYFYPSSAVFCSSESSSLAVRGGGGGGGGRRLETVLAYWPAPSLPAGVCWEWEDAVNM